MKKFLIALLGISVLLTVLFYNYFPTGNAVGNLNVTIYSLASINFTMDFINFGSGSVYLNSSSASIDTRGNVTGGNWTPISQGFIVENIGNTNLSVFLKSGKNAVDFLGGTSPGYYYMFNNSEANSCTQPSIIIGNWFAVNTTGYGDKICNNMQYSDSNDSIRIDLKLVIPSDAMRGSREDVFTVTGVSS